MFQTFRGSPALSEFRIQGLMQKFHLPQINSRKITFCARTFKPSYVVPFQWAILIVLYK